MLSCSFFFFLLLLLCPTSIELLMKEITVLRHLRRYPGVLSVQLSILQTFLPFEIYIQRYMNVFSLRKIDGARQIEDSDMRQLRQAIYRTTAGTISLIIVLFMGPSCACFCSIDEWRHATKHRLKIDAPCELNDQSKRARGRKSISISLMCTYTIQ